MQEPTKFCPRCRAQNQMSAAFCYSCGAHFPQTPFPQQQPKKQSGMTLLIICGVLVFGCAGLTAIGSLMKDSRSMSSATPTPTSTLNPTTPDYSSASSARATTDAGVTMANYNRIQTGMTYAQVCKILGKDGTERSRNDDARYHTVVYQWQGDDLANMNAIFQNDKLVSKAQFGLK
jgi:hypothetical protein